ncbi:MAG: divergent PAP2 family protein [Spirochaetales bacterium]|nr:divergent PAP2 family protein [Spirochaetales bacterium]
MKQIIPLSISLISALIVEVLSQISKFISYSIKDKAINIKYLFTTGGMPSSHSAFVTALSVSIGLWNGFQSDLFAISFVFSAVIVHDAFRLRGSVQAHARILNKFMSLLPEKERVQVEEMIGHSLPEIIAGVIFGGIIAGAVYVLIKLF